MSQYLFKRCHFNIQIWSSFMEKMHCILKEIIIKIFIDVQQDLKLELLQGKISVCINCERRLTFTISPLNYHWRVVLADMNIRSFSCRLCGFDDSVSRWINKKEHSVGSPCFYNNYDFIDTHHFCPLTKWKE